MHVSEYPSHRPCLIPAECYNLARLLRLQQGGYLKVPLPGLTDNLMILRETGWQCWNRKLGKTLITWDDFRRSHRKGLHEPLTCTQTLHHSYGRTIIHRIYESLNTRLRWELSQTRPEGQAKVLALRNTA